MFFFFKQRVNHVVVCCCHAIANRLICPYDERTSVYCVRISTVDSCAKNLCAGIQRIQNGIGIERGRGAQKMKFTLIALFMLVPLNIVQYRSAVSSNAHILVIGRKRLEISYMYLHINIFQIPCNAQHSHSNTVWSITKGVEVRIFVEANCQIYLFDKR